MAEQAADPQTPPPKPSSPLRKITRSVDEHEAVRRGLTFGPIKSRGQNVLKSDKLKPTADSPPPEESQRTRSPNVEQDSSRDLQDTRERDTQNSPLSRSKLEGESSDEEELWSSGDEGTETRGRKKGDRNDRRREGSLSSNEGLSRRAESIESQPSSTVTEAEDKRSDEKPDDKKTSSKTFHVHPNTNFDKPVPKPVSGVRPASPTASEEEEFEATSRAQLLPIYTSKQDSSVPHRVIQTFIRGDFALMQREARDGLRRLRTYLAATDLSGEAAYALEWTIGTVLRDGDTLYAIYAVDEEVGTGVEKEGGLPVGQGAAAMQETAAKMEMMTAESQKKPLMSFPPLPRSVLRPSSRKGSAATSTDSRVLSVAQQERVHALNKLQETCLGLLRKTALQCRIVIEVIHCNNPKYMITEAIDGIKPEMTIIGSRGRGSLKGVLLGSFSNYIVTKSSCPVMVARKRLSGRKTKIPAPNVRLTNNLRPSSRLSDARID